MKKFACSLAALCLLFAACNITKRPAQRQYLVPPLPPVPTGKFSKLSTAAFVPASIALESTPPPSSWGWSYTSQTSGLPLAYWMFGYSGLPDVFVAHNFRHNPITGDIILSWPSNPTNQYRVWWTQTNGVLYPFYVYWTNIMRGTNWEQWPQFPTIIAWTNSTRTEIVIPGPTNRASSWPGYILVGKVK